MACTRFKFAYQKFMKFNAWTVYNKNVTDERFLKDLGDACTAGDAFESDHPKDSLDCISSAQADYYLDVGEQFPTSN